MITGILSASRRASLGAGLVIVVAALAAYHNSLHGPFVFDDRPAIEENSTIRAFATAWFPPPGALPVSGRPLLNLTLALNYAISGTSVWSYHALNLLIHVLAGLTLYGIVRRTMEGRRAGLSSGAAAAAHPDGLALAVALLWTVHPLQTESVTYLSQRAESLMGLFYLLTLYGFVRGAQAEREGGGGGPWFTLSVIACLLGLLTKEVMVSAPLLVLLYDRTFCSGSFTRAWRRHRVLYAGLAGGWVLLGAAAASAGMTRGGTSGAAFPAPWWTYWLTQFAAVARYLRLSVWPSPLAIYYEPFRVTNVGQTLLPALIVLGLASATAWAVVRRPAAGFLGVWFFAILAPTSLVPNDIQMIAEHRMYLPLAAVMMAAVAALFFLLGRSAGLALCLAAVVGFGFATERRNEVYRSKVSLWADTVAQRPANAFAHNNLGEALFEQGLFPEALAQYRAASLLRPGADSIYAQVNAGLALERMGRLPEAIAEFREAVRMEPGWAGIHEDLAEALNHAGRLTEAIGEYRQALQLKRDYAQAEHGLGTALFRSGDIAAALVHFQAAVRIDPDYPEAWNNLGTALATLNRFAEAGAAYRHALQLRPDYHEARNNLDALERFQATR